MFSARDGLQRGNNNKQEQQKARFGLCAPEQISIRNHQDVPSSNQTVHLRMPKPQLIFSPSLQTNSLPTPTWPISWQCTEIALAGGENKRKPSSQSRQHYQSHHCPCLISC